MAEQTFRHIRKLAILLSAENGDLVCDPKIKSNNLVALITLQRLQQSVTTLSGQASEGNLHQVTIAAGGPLFKPVSIFGN